MKNRLAGRSGVGQAAIVVVVDFVRIVDGVAELVRRDHLLRERREVSSPLSLAEINKDSAVFPNAIMVAAIAGTRVREAAG